MVSYLKHYPQVGK